MAQVYTFTDSNGEVRLMAEINPAPGGAQPVIAAYVGLTGDLALSVSGAPIAFDAVAFDPGGYWDAANKQFVIPAGKDGYYIIGGQFAAAPADSSATDVSVGINNSGADASLATSLAGPAQFFTGCPSLLIQAAAGDTLQAEMTWSGGPGVTPVSLRGGANGSVMWLAYLGPAA